MTEVSFDTQAHDYKAETTTSTVADDGKPTTQYSL
jgi:hypothetical protein